MNEYRMQSEEGEIPIRIVRSHRKSLAMDVRGGVFTARAPVFVSDGYIYKFIEKNRPWVEEQMKRVAAEREETKGLLALPERPLTPKEKRNVKDAIEDRTRYWANRMIVTYGKITVRNQKTRWGSCSSNGNLNFNYKIYFMPRELMDYVIIHELSHRVHMNHSKEFWHFVARYCPDYKECIRKLKKINL